MSPNPLNYGDIKLKSKHGEKLHLRSMQGQEDLSRPFEYRLVVWSDPFEFKTKELLGSTMTISMPLDVFGKKRYFHGHVTSVALTGIHDGYPHYSVVLRPWFWLLSYNSECRISQQKSALDIAKEIFDKRGFSYRFALSQDSYRKYEYSVQYRESDFAYLSRLFEQEGIYYFVEHKEDKHTLVLCDAPESHADDENKGEFEHRAWSLGNAVGEPHFDHWQPLARVTSGAYATTDYDFERPRAELGQSSQKDPLHEYDHDDAEVFDFPGEYVTVEEAEPLVKARMQALHSPQERVDVRGNTRPLGAGHTFTLVHKGKGEDGEYLVIRSGYEINAGAPDNKGAASPSYHCTLEVCKKAVPFRPLPLTSKPLISGHQTARVVGDGEIFTDKYGRVKVEFPWDRQKDRSCWIRVAQVWAGPGMGAMHVPRVGHEVLVSFLEGDPDRPIITGRVYNGNAMPPWDLPGKDMVSGVKSESTPGGGGYNEISLDDTKGSELVLTHAQKDQTTIVEHDQDTVVGNNRSADIGEEDVETVGANQTVTITDNQTISVGKNHMLTTLEGGSTETIAAAKLMVVGAGLTFIVTGASVETVSTDKSTKVTGSQELTVGKGSVETVQAGDKNVKVASGALTQSADKAVTVTAGASMSLSAKDSVLIKGKTGTIELTDSLTIKVGSAKITMSKNGDIALNGAKINVSGSGDIAMKGSKITQN